MKNSLCVVMAMLVVAGVAVNGSQAQPLLEMAVSSRCEALCERPLVVSQWDRECALCGIEGLWGFAAWGDGYGDLWAARHPAEPIAAVFDPEE